jgi:HK97 family phage major capsid protein
MCCAGGWISRSDTRQHGASLKAARWSPFLLPESKERGETLKTKEREDRQRYKQLVDEQRALLDKAEAEGRGLTAEEKEEYDRRQKDRDELRATIDAYEERDKLRAENTAEALRLLEGEGRQAGGQEQPEGTPETRTSKYASEEYRAAFKRYLVGGFNGLQAEEARALQADADVLGGYLVAPEQLVRSLLKAVDDQVVIRQFATTIPVENAASLGVPTLEHDVSDADWTAELAVGTEDNDLDFGKRELHPHPLAKYIRVSNKLMRAAFLDPESLVIDRLAYKFGAAQENAFMVGDGAQKPLGLFVPSPNGISVARDMATDNTAAEVRADNLKRCKWMLKAQYHSGARWLFHRDIYGQIDRLKDGNGQYLVQPSMQGGAAERLLNFPVQLSEFAPNTVAANQYVGLLGDLKFYWIADALSMQIQRLVELFALTNQTGFIGRLETDGQPVLEEAFVRVQLGV